jgi:hypothetical protein
MLLERVAHAAALDNVGSSWKDALGLRASRN